MSRHLEITFIAVCACAGHSFNHARQIKNAAKYNKGSCRQHKVCIHNLWPATYRKHLTSGYTAQCPSSGGEACGCSPVLGGRSKMLEESISWTSKISTASCRAVLAPPACLASVAASLLRKMKEPRKWVGEVMVGRGKGKEGGILRNVGHVWTCVNIMNRLNIRLAFSLGSVRLNTAVIITSKVDVSKVTSLFTAVLIKKVIFFKLKFTSRWLSNLLILMAFMSVDNRIEIIACGNLCRPPAKRTVAITKHF